MRYLVPLLAGSLLIPIPQVGNASLIEIIWFLVGMAAYLYSMWSLPSVITDYIVAQHAVEANTKMGKARTLLARGHVRRELIRHAQALIIMGIGLYALITPNPIPKISLTGLVVTAGLVLLAALIVFQSALDHTQRKNAEEVLREND